MSDSDRDENSVTAVTMAEGDTASSVDATVNEPSPSPEVKRRGGFIAWLALLLVVGLGGGVLILVPAYNVQQLGCHWVYILMSLCVKGELPTLYSFHKLFHGRNT